MFNRKILTIAISAIILNLTVTGCSSSHSSSYNEEESISKSLISKGLEDSKNTITPNRKVLAEIIRGNQYQDVNDYSLIDRDMRRLPSTYRKNVRLYNDKKKENKGYTLDSFASELYEGYGVVLDVSDPDLLNMGSAKSPDSGGDDLASSKPSVERDSTNTSFSLESPAANPPATLSRDDLRLKPINYSGDVKGLLDYVSISNGLNWKFDPNSGRAYLFMMDTKTYYVSDFMKETTDSTRITNTTKVESEGTSGGSSKRTEKKDLITPWEDLTKTINSMISEDEHASFNRKSGGVTVSARSFTQSRINNYITDLNTQSDKRIMVTLRILNVTDVNNISNSVNASYLNNSLQNNLFGSFDLNTGLGSYSPSITESLSVFQEVFGGNFLTLANESFEMLVGMLNTVGTTKVQFEVSHDIKNNETFAFQGSVNQEYIDSIQRSEFRENSESNLSTEKAVATDGTNVTFKARVDRDKIGFEYAIANSDFLNLKDAGNNALEGIKLKSDQTNDIASVTSLENGITQVLTVIHKEEASTDSSGFLDDALWFLGGDEAVTKKKSMIVITATAYIMEG